MVHFSVCFQFPVLHQCLYRQRTCHRPLSPWSGSDLWRPTGKSQSIPLICPVRVARTHHKLQATRSYLRTFYHTHPTTWPLRQQRVKALGTRACCCSCTPTKTVILFISYYFLFFLFMSASCICVCKESHFCPLEPMSPPRNLMIYNYTAVSVWLRWEPPLQPSGVILQYSFRVRDLITHSVTYQVLQFILPSLNHWLTESLHSGYCFPTHWNVALILKVRYHQRNQCKATWGWDSLLFHSPDDRKKNLM